MWYSMVAYLFFKKPVLQYTDTHILKWRNHALNFSTPFPFEYLEKVVKHSPHSFGFFLTEASPVTYQGKYEEVKLREFTINGNENDLQKLAETLNVHKIPVIDDPIPDNDPTKQSAILGISVVLIIALVVTVIFLVTRIH